MLLLLAVALPPAACVEAPHAVTPDADVMSSLPAWGMSRDLVIGREDDARYALTRVGGLALSPRGDVLVAEVADRHIRVFDREGTFLRAIGRPGEGPGEFLRLREIGLLGDTVWAGDSRQNSLVHYFDLGGGLQGTREVPPLEPPYGGTGRFYPLADGGVVMPTTTGSAPIDPGAGLPWLRWSANDSLAARLPGGVVPEFTWFDLPPIRTAGGMEVARRPVRMSPPFTPSVWSGLAPDHSSIVRADFTPGDAGAQGTLRVVRFTLDGDTTAAVALPIERRPIPEHVVDGYFGALVEAFLTNERIEVDERDLRALHTVPEHYPPLRGLVVGYGGRVWLEMEGHGERRRLLLDADLRPLALVETPEGFSFMAASGEHVWGVELDDFSVPRVFRYRLVAAM